MTAGPLDAHRALEVAVDRAARHAAARRPENARAQLAFANATFQAHRSAEEGGPLRAWADVTAAPENLGARVLLRDHARIAELFDRSVDAEGLALCDAIDDLAGALEHHDLREQRGMLAWIAASGVHVDWPDVGDPPEDHPEDPVPLVPPAGWDGLRAQILLGRPFPLDDALGALPAGRVGDRARARLLALPDDPARAVRALRRVGWALDALRGTFTAGSRP